MSNQMRSNILQKIVGNITDFDLQHRFVNSVSFFGVVIASLAVVINFLTGLYWVINLITGIGGVLTGIFYYRSRFLGRHQEVVWPLIITLLGVLDFTWFVNAGINGPIAFTLLLGLTMATVITEGKGQQYLVLIFLSNLTILTGIEFFYPDWIMPYPDRISRFLDFHLTNAYTIALIYFFVLATMKQYHRERGKAEAEKKKAEQANELLNEKQVEILAQNEELNSMNEKVENQNAVLTMSIRAALSIQKTILPKRAVMEQYFQYAVLYKPKDVVSGDFYWFCTAGKFQFVAVVDCTGHGVPGAFMSLISHRLLSEIIEVRAVYDPGKILTRLHASIRTTLQQEITNDHNGLDICLCRIENEETKHEVVYAGAKCPLYHFSAEENVVHKIDADRKSIGGVNYKTDFNFESKRVPYALGDRLYLSSDGFIDQNNVERVRYGSPRFADLLSRLSASSLDSHKEQFKEELRLWSNGAAQRDDITIMSIQL